LIAQWASDVIGKMHQYEIKQTELAEHLKYNPKYLSQLLNCRKTPKNAESIVRRGLDELIALRQEV
jgi:predicted transcriptional regulator